jgi:tight adherence protein B
VGAVLTALILAIVAGYGVHLVFTSQVVGWRGLGPGPRQQATARTGPPPPRDRARDWLTQAGLGEVGSVEFATVLGALFVVGSTAGALIFAGVLPAILLGAFAGSAPIATYRRRRATRLERARDAWPRLIEEIRILTGSAGRSVPQALLEVGLHGPSELRPAFEAAQREWLLSTDFGRTLDVLKRRLADPTADSACETLLIAHELGGTDLDARLDALADDRRQDMQGRKDARARQAGVRFARRFVLIVPFGMAVVGLSIGNGRAAYQTPMGQVVVAVALMLVVACWAWSGRIMRLPDEQRVFP